MKRNIFYFCFVAIFCHGYVLAGYVDNNDGTITDTSTNLIWEKSSGVSTYNWNQAKEYCEILTLGGKNGWRLPTRNELQSLVDYSISSGPTISIIYFPDTVADYYWSSTTYAEYPDSAWVVSFSKGYIVYSNKTTNYSVRAVRSIKCETDSGCPAKQVLGAGNPKLVNLRDFRDNKLAQNAIGRKAIQIYYSNVDSINAALERSPALRTVTRRVLEVIAPLVGNN